MAAHDAQGGTEGCFASAVEDSVYAVAVGEVHDRFDEGARGGNDEVVGAGPTGDCSLAFG